MGPGRVRRGDQESPWIEVFQEPHCKVSALVHFLPLGPLKTKALCKCGGSTLGTRTWSSKSMGDRKNS